MPAYTLRGAQVWDGDDAHTFAVRDLHMSERVLTKAGRGERAIDLDGYTIFPALVNAHDHLELNHYPRSKFRERYDNAHQWGEDMSARLDDEPFKSLRAYPLADRCFIGGLKNLLCGALTVAHHNPPHKCLFKRDFPVRVLRRYGWAHSLHFTPEAEIVRSYRATPSDVPWFIHLAEGTDERAAREYQRLKALGCIGKNTVIVHGVGMTEADIADAAPRVRGLVVCPTTNLYLLGKTADVALWHKHGGSVWLGSDSRLTADGDLLAERAALPQVQRQRVRVHEEKAGIVGSEADFIVCREQQIGQRADLALLLRGGVPQMGDPEVMAQFADVQTVPVLLDGRAKRIHITLARQIARCSLREVGLELDADFVKVAEEKRVWEW
jgi:hypothetical protein